MHVVIIISATISWMRRDNFQDNGFSVTFGYTFSCVQWRNVSRSNGSELHFYSVRWGAVSIFAFVSWKAISSFLVSSFQVRNGTQFPFSTYRNTSSTLTRAQYTRASNVHRRMIMILIRGAHCDGIVCICNIIQNQWHLPAIHCFRI